jgi:hypothetical protein
MSRVDTFELLPTSNFAFATATCATPREEDMFFDLDEYVRDTR